MPEDLRDHYLRALLLLRDMFDALAFDHLEDAPATVPLQIPVDQLLAWRTRAAALPLEEAGRVWLTELSRDAQNRNAAPTPFGGELRTTLLELVGRSRLCGDCSVNVRHEIDQLTLPPVVLLVGDTVTTDVELKALPVGAVVRSRTDGVFARAADGWQRVGVEDTWTVALPARVLDLPLAA